MTKETKITEFSFSNDALLTSLFKSMEAREILASFLEEVTSIPKEEFMDVQFVYNEFSDMIMAKNSEISKTTIRLEHCRISILWKDSRNTTDENGYPKLLIVDLSETNPHHVDVPVQKFQLMDKNHNIYLGDDKMITYRVILENLERENQDNIIFKKFGAFWNAKNIEEMEQIATKYPEYFKIVQKLKSLLKDPLFVDYYDYVSMAQKSFDAIQKSAFQEGILEKRNSIMEKLKERNMTDEEIEEIVGPDPRTVTVYI